MVLLHVRGAGNVLLFSVTLPDTATVRNVLELVGQHAPQLREHSLKISNAKLGTSFELRAPMTRNSVDAQRLAQTLMDAGLVQRGAAEESLSILPYAPAPSGTATLPATEAATRMMQLFAQSAGTAVAPSSSSSSPSHMAAAAAFARARVPAATNPIASARPSAPAAAAPAAASAAPLDVEDATGMTAEEMELQRRLYAHIQQQQIDENLANALEFTPEAFARVNMLYVSCTINQIPIKAFVDSGAQSSIMNKSTAERCGLMRLLDVRMRGVAVGVGRQEIIGRIHMTPVNLSGMHVPFAFYVIEDQPMDLIIGLDQLKRHQMLINLRDNCLVIDDVTVPFLPESELPTSANAEVNETDANDEGGAAAQAADPNVNEEVVPQPRGLASAPLDSIATGSPGPNSSSTPSSPAVAAAAAAAPAFAALTEAERQSRVASFMDFTGITDAEAAARLLEAADWDADDAAALFFSD